MNRQRLIEAGIDYDRGVKRFMNDHELYESVLAFFLEDTAMERAKSAYQSGDEATLFRCAHELKGACGNADMTELYAEASALVELLRPGAQPHTPEQLQQAFASFESAYNRVMTGIREACD